MQNRQHGKWRPTWDPPCPRFVGINIENLLQNTCSRDVLGIERIEYFGRKTTCATSRTQLGSFIGLYNCLSPLLCLRLREHGRPAEMELDARSWRSFCHHQGGNVPAAVSVQTITAVRFLVTNWRRCQFPRPGGCCSNWMTKGRGESSSAPMSINTISTNRSATNTHKFKAAAVVLASSGILLCERALHGESERAAERLNAVTPQRHP